MKRSALELAFEESWDTYCPDLPLEEEAKIIPGRKYRFDFVHHPSKTCIEIQGGNLIGGRHTRPEALDKEYEKILLASALGYTTVFLSDNMIDDFQFIELIRNTILLRQNTAPSQTQG